MSIKRFKYAKRLNKWNYCSIYLNHLIFYLYWPVKKFRCGMGYTLKIGVNLYIPVRVKDDFKMQSKFLSKKSNMVVKN